MADSQEFILIILVWVGVVLAPWAAVVSFVLIQASRPRLLKPVAVSCMVALITVIGLTALGIRFTILLANVICLILSYIAFCFLAFSCWRIRLKILKFPAVIAMAAPMALGYALATVGLLGFMFIVGDFVRAPFRKQTMKAGLECRLTVWGGPASDSGYTVHLYKRCWVLPILEREVATIVVNQSNPGDGSKEATCDDALEQYTGQHSP